MSRAVDSTQAAALAAAHRSSHVRVLIEDPNGDLQDMTDLASTDWLFEVSVEANADNPIGSATILLWREKGALSLAPLMEASTLNRASGDVYAPFLIPARAVEVWIATLDAGDSPGSGDWVLLWEGQIDEPEWGGKRPRVTLHARDPMARLNDTIIETESTYGGGSPLAAIEDVMQEILNDNFGSGAFPLTVVGDPDFGVEEYPLANVSVLEALVALRDLIGWNLHWLWDEGAGEFRLTFYEPARDAADLSGYTPDDTFSPDQYHGVTNIRLAQAGIRNKGEVLYTDSSGNAQSVEDERSASVALYDVRFIRLDEQGGSIKTSAQADALLAAVLDDLEAPPAVQRVEAAFHWPIELGDTHRYEANGKHYDVDQDYAVFGYRHVLNSSTRRTFIDASGKPSGGFRRWHSRDSADSGLESGEPELDGVFDVALIPVMQASSRRHEFEYNYRWEDDVDEAEVRLSWTEPGPTFITLVKVMAQSGDGVAPVEENLSSTIAKIPEDATDLLFSIKGRHSAATAKWGKTFSWRLDDMADSTAGVRTSDGTNEYLSKRSLVGRGLSLALVAGEPEIRLETDVEGAGSKSADFTLDADDGLIQSVSISASVDLTNISNLIGSEPFLLRLAAAANTLTLDGTNFEGPKLTFTGTAAISFVDFGTGKITAMGGDW